jgi:Beta-1,4-xylanase
MKSLKEVYEQSFLIGNIYTPEVLKNKELRQMLETQFNVLTAENIMKPALMQPSRDKFVFGAADNMMHYAKENGFKVVGHTLAWHQQTLSFIDEEHTSKEEALKLLRAHIEQMLTRYKGKMISWDVLNEAIEDGVQEDTKEWRKHLRNTPWLRMIGEDYVSYVFQIAHELEPNTILYYNDYNLNYRQKREATYYMVKELREAGVPIQGIGMQGHYHTNTQIQTVKDSLELFSKLDGIEISITELDVTVTGAEKLKVLSKEYEIEQAGYYAQLFQIYKEYEQIIKRITFWGTDDKTSWRSERFPTIFNKDYSPKQSFYAILDPDKFLQEYPLEKRENVQTGVAMYGTPVLGNAQTWDTKNPLSVSRQLTAWEGANALAYVMWDNENLYIMANVTVAALNAFAQEFYNKDCVDIFISLSNERSQRYQRGDSRLTVTFENEIEWFGKEKMEGMESFAVQTKEGYQIQAKIPFKQSLEVGSIIGFDIQVNDSDVHGVRQSIATWNDITGESYNSTIGFGNLKLQK